MLPLASTCALVALLLTAPSPATPPSPEAARGEVLRLLDTSGDAPREDTWARLGPEALSELFALVGDAKLPETQRLRAVAALAVVAHPEASQRLQELLKDPAAPSAVRMTAIEALGRRAGLAAVAPLTPLLTDTSEPVRACAARTLGHIGGTQARGVLEARLSLEKSPAVREALQQALSYLEP